LLSVCSVSSTLLQTGNPASAPWATLIAETTDPYYKSVYQAFENVGAPSAACAVQTNTNPNLVQQTAPAAGQWLPGQYWLGVGWGTGYNTVMRTASNTKPFTRAIYEQHLTGYLNSSFYALWNDFAVGGEYLPNPLDQRVKSITIQQLLDHTSGMTNTQFGYDPAFDGQTCAAQLPGLLTGYTLATAPGATYSYLNFGYEILATLVPALSGLSYAQQMKNLFPSPSTIPVYLADDNVAAPGETSVYWAVAPDGTFSVNPMVGCADLVTNAITLSWFATQYYIGGDNLGKKFSAVPTTNTVWIFDGSMPGTSSASVQYINSHGQVSAAACITNFRPTDNAAGNAFLGNLNTALLNLLEYNFS